MARVLTGILSPLATLSSSSRPEAHEGDGLSVDSDASPCSVVFLDGPTPTIPGMASSIAIRTDVSDEAFLQGRALSSSHS